ncbi:hypothetical protein CLF_108460 [Clonorchis sinensis]|uniref:Transmembrane protein n=1 Tax=Clonorchis sinensis TaxID=79923 RepID=H2KS83_CLOSI|nr:hypothetical protein CLF_108460 [Clonorchis sinensis]
MDHYLHGHGKRSPRLGDSIGTPARVPPSVTTSQQPSSRLFQIALQATVANADAARAESEELKTNLEKKKPSQGTQVHRSVHLTPQQWQLLTDYHEHDLFIRTRSWGFCLAIFGVGVAVFGMGSPAWKWIGDIKKPYEMGLWAMCYPNSSCIPLVYHLKDDWKMHTSVICFLGCGCLFGFLGIGLAVTGACRSALIIRMYYYHSAGECFLVSGIATGGSLILYPFTANNCIRNLVEHGVIEWTQLETLERIPKRFAYNYYLNWCASCFFLASFVCMNLDILIQSCVRPKPCLSATWYHLRQCWTRFRTDRSKETQITPANSPRSVNCSTHTNHSNSVTLSSNNIDNNAKNFDTLLNTVRIDDGIIGRIGTDGTEDRQSRSCDHFLWKSKDEEVYLEETDDGEWI